MILQYRNISGFSQTDRLIFQICLFFEFFISIFVILTFLISAKYMIKYNFHLNFKIIMHFTMIGFVVDVVARMIIILYEAEVLDFEIPEIPSKPWQNEVNDLIFVCSLIRVFYMVIISNAALMFACERYFATIFIENYEKTSRSWIPILLILPTCLAAIFGSIVFHFEFIPLWFTGFLGFFMNFTSFFAFFGLYLVNWKKLQIIKTREINEKYSLSYRFQLNENVKVMRWVKTISLFVTTIDCSLIFVFIGASLENFENISVYFHFILNLSLVIYGQSALFLALLCDKTFRKIFLKNKHIRSFTYPFFNRWFPKDFAAPQNRSLSTNEETDIYFTNLSSQWAKIDLRKPVLPEIRKRKSGGKLYNWMKKYRKKLNRVESSNATVTSL
ncbi:unnamed protein product [Caenorhabditis angaria]|uniref:Uncharacterized protein n=1 Tax=Caenorhabditis angaria TaxID=860376 RepID=A0A9P1IBW6_9PELO|nr:unnamed protein product [Caenorhabditis angaria]